MNPENDTIGLLGGTFDPVHNGHLAIARSFLNSPYISELWILLTPDPPHKNEDSLSSYKHRFKMLELAFSNWDHVVISDVEKKLSKPSYTIQTLRHLNSEFPDKIFYLCVGEDSARNFKDWYQWKEILKTTELLIAQRNSSKALNLDPQVTEKAHIVSHKPVDISSTEIREKISRGQDYTNLLPKPVVNFIKEQQLYQS